MKVDAIIQARTAATRLPGKVLMTIMDKSILEYVIERVRMAERVDRIIVATTTEREDSRIADLAIKLGALSYRGSETDVLDRFYQAARSNNVTHLARITADCPLIDPAVIDNLISEYFKTNADYCSNILIETFPDGEDVEVLSFKALSEAWQNAGPASEREHVTPYIKKHPEKFKLFNVKNEPDLSSKRWTLDTPEDFMFIETVLKALYPKNPKFGMADILRFIRENPHVEKVNKGIVRNEGYLKSLKEDSLVKPQGRTAK